MSERLQSFRTAACAGLAFGVFYGLIMTVIEGRFPSIGQGGSAALIREYAGNALFFAVLIWLFLRSPIIPKAADLPLEPGETLVHTGLANHFLNFEGRGGRLALTSTHLRFVPHAVNLQRGSVDIPLAEIANVRPVRIFKIIPNGIAVTRSSGKVERFAVNARMEWLDALNRIVKRP